MGALTFAIGAVLLLTFLFNRTRLIDFEQHAAYLGALRQLGELDATLDKHVLEVRYGLLTHYDPLNKDLSELRETRARLAQFPALLSPQSRQQMNEALQRLDGLLDEKTEELNRFKSWNANLKNSLAYLPTLTRETGERDANTWLAAAEATFNRLLRKLFVFNQTADPRLAESIRNDLIILRDEVLAAEEEEAIDTLESASAHVNLVLNRKPRVDALVRDIVAIPIPQVVSTLQARYSGDYNEALQTTNLYRLALYGISILLLIGIAWAFRALRSSNQALEERVLARTEELEDSNAALARQSEEARLLHRTAEFAAETEALREALDDVAQRVCELTGSPVGFVFERTEEDPQKLVTTSAWRLERNAEQGTFSSLQADLSYNAGEGLPGRILESGEPERLTGQGVGDELQQAKKIASVDVSSAFAFPVSVQGEVIAVLEFYSSEEMDLDEGLIQLTRNIGGQLGRVFERKRAQEQLRIARQAAETANRAKSAFLANMSHELRTPMNAIIGYSEMLIEDAEDDGNEEAVADLRKIRGAGKHLLALINDVLDLSKIESGRMDVLIEELDIPELLDEVVATAAALVEKQDNRLEIERDPSAETMRGDVTKIRQALLNLLSNAAKFTKEGTIRLTCRVLDEVIPPSIEFAVADSGIGIAADKLDHIFEEFSQAEETTTRDFGGTGLGLAISRRFCRMQGGDITVKSTPGEGSTFTIRLPQNAQRVESELEGGTN